MNIEHSAEEWQDIREQLHAIINSPHETAARRAEAERILAMRPKVRPARTDDLFAIEYGL